MSERRIILEFPWGIKETEIFIQSFGIIITKQEGRGVVDIMMYKSGFIIAF